MSAPSVVVEGLRVTYGATSAIDGVDLEVERGTTVGVLGHNGAGKTTLIRVLTTLVRPTGGRASVDGLDVVHDADRVRRRIGVTGQYAGLDEFLTGRENLELVGRLAGLGRHAPRRAGELIDRLGLGDVAAQRVGRMSGGSRRRIDVAASLVSAPTVLFLDEPTTGLDPTGRATLWELVDELTASGTTVVLTTQYLEEADRLANHVAVLDHGRIVARGTPAELKRMVGGKVVTATVSGAALDRLPFTPDTKRPAGPGKVTVTFAADDVRDATHLVTELAADVFELEDLDIASPALDDVFAHLTPKGAQP